jgi:hypothetical protein
MAGSFHWDVHRYISSSNDETAIYLHQRVICQVVAVFFRDPSVTSSRIRAQTLDYLPVATHPQVAPLEGHFSGKSLSDAS